MKRARKIFSVIEYSSFFQLQHNATGQTAHIGDGVDTLFTPTGKAVSPGSKCFRARLERSYNSDVDCTLEAYFPEIYAQEA